MAHHRNRWIEPRIKSLLSFSPIVGLIGQRQTGKTTVISSFAKDYRTLGLFSELALANEDPQFYLRNHAAPFAIDECQMSPALFPALKEHVRVNRKPGQFLLSGSIRFTSKKQIKESLTGRIAMLELQPFALSELHSCPCPSLDLFKNAKTHPLRTDKEWSQFFNTGGLPGICFRRSQGLLHQGFEDHLNTLLDRDIRQIVNTKLSLPTLREVLTQLGMQVGSKLNLEAICRLARISKPTLKGLIAAFEAMFLIRVIPIRGGIQSRTVFFEDVGLLQHLVKGNLSQRQVEVNALYQCIRVPYYCNAEARFSFEQYETRGGAFAPLVVDHKNTKTAIILTPYSEPGMSEIKSAQSFLKSSDRARVIICGPKLKYKAFQDRLILANLLSLV